jgi:isopropylmalate/homocitrate/citramalate synthase
MYNFADEIKFHDVTLRDGEQQSGLVFNKDQKVAIAEKLAEVGIQRIEAGMPVVIAQDAQAIEEIAKRKKHLNMEVFTFAAAWPPTRPAGL